ncbi:MAG: tol-pal system protein YbgF [Deltaproteobacteria bacterium]|nr:tol-pal system protein YbgF [Deltaproteobacteria bacterium]
MTKEEGRRLEARLKHQGMLVQELKETQRLAQKNLRHSIKEVFKEVKDRDKKNIKHKSDLVMEIQDLEKEILKLNGKAEESNFKRGKLQKELEEDQEVIAARFADVEARLQNLEKAFKKIQESYTQDEKNSKGKLLVKANEPKSAEDRYGQALAVFKLGDQTLARKMFQDFLKDYPRHKLAGNAQYWLAETYYESKDYKKAILEFQKIRDNYKKTDKRDDALLKLGYCFAALGLKKEAKIFLKELISKFPRSDLRRAAKAKLKQLRGTRKRSRQRRKMH